MERKRKEETPLEEHEQFDGFVEPGDEPQDEAPEKEDEKKKLKDPIMEHWATMKERPGDDQIEAWKAQFGECFLMSFDANENYVWRPIKRLEYKNILQQAKDDAHYHEMVVQRCVLWPSIGPDVLTGGKAGTIPTLYAVIMEGSNFLEPDQAVMLVRKL